MEDYLEDTGSEGGATRSVRYDRTPGNFAGDFLESSEEEEEREMEVGKFTIKKEESEEEETAQEIRNLENSEGMRSWDVKKVMQKREEEENKENNSPSEQRRVNGIVGERKKPKLEEHGADCDNLNIIVVKTFFQKNVLIIKVEINTLE